MAIAPLRGLLYLATSGAIVSSAAALMGRGISPAATGAYLAAYSSLIALGVIQPASRIFSDAVTSVPEGFALTFDDGPDPEHTPRVLDALEARGARGTFFLIGRKLERHPDVARDLVARGHAVGAHGYTHDRLYALRGTSWLERDADREDQVWRDVLGEPPVLFRPPIGLINPRIARVCEARDRVVVAWTVRPRDGLARTTSAQVTARVVRRLREGAIVLLHDAAESGDRTPAAVAALPAILDAAARLGVSARTVPVPDLEPQPDPPALAPGASANPSPTAPEEKARQRP